MKHDMNMADRADEAIDEWQALLWWRRLWEWIRP